MLVAVIKDTDGESRIVGRFETNQQAEAIALLQDIVAHNSRISKGALFIEYAGDKTKIVKRVNKGIFGKVRVK